MVQWVGEAAALFYQVFWVEMAEDD